MPKIHSKNLERIFDFFHQVAHLKTTWRYKEHSRILRESTADHSWRLSIMTIALADELNIKLNIEQAIKIALIHDVVEAIAGDVSAVAQAENKKLALQKHKNEIRAMKKLQSILPPKIGKKFYEIWQEYSDSKTREAKFVRALNKLEGTTHLIEAGYKTYDNPDFIVQHTNSASKDFPQLAKVVEVLKQKLKKEFRKGKIKWKKEYDG
jgi:putative hydrolase of HD superfamily